MIRVLVVDDHPVVQGGLAAALRSEVDFEVVGIAGSVDEGRRLLADAEVDVALLDVRLPDGSGFDLMRDIRESGPAWIVLSSFDLPQYLARTVRLGGSAYLLKTAPMTDICTAIRAAAARRVSFSAEQLRVARATDDQHLTSRDRDLVRLVVAGRSNDEIGAALNLRRKTIETYLSRLYERLGCSSRSELAARAVREAWLED